MSTRDSGVPLVSRRRAACTAHVGSAVTLAVANSAVNELVVFCFTPARNLLLLMIDPPAKNAGSASLPKRLWRDPIPFPRHRFIDAASMRRLRRAPTGRGWGPAHVPPSYQHCLHAGHRQTQPWAGEPEGIA